MTASYAIFRGGLKINAYEKILLMAICLFLLLPFGIQFKKSLDENKKIEIHNQRVKNAQECIDARQWKCAENSSCKNPDS